MSSGGPNFLVIGAQKAASTSLLAGLRAHPDVWMPPDEDPFLRDPLYDVRRLPDFLAKYEGHRELAVGLKCPDYLARPEVPDRVAALLPACRFIAILRNPVDRAISAYFWYVRWGVLPVVDASVGLTKLLDGDYDAEPTASEILDWGLYDHHLLHWSTVVPHSNILVLRDTDLRRDAASVLSRTFLHLGVDPVAQNSSDAGSRNEGIYPAPRLRFVRTRNRWLIDRHESGYWNVFPPSRRGPRLVSNAIAGTDRYLLRRLYGNEPPIIRPEVRERLTSFYRADCAGLAKRYGPNPEDWP